MQFEGAGSPKLGESTAGTRPDMVTVMPAAELCETTFVTIKMDKNFSVDSPDQHEAPPTCTANWSSEESFAEDEQPSRFFPDDADSGSSPICPMDEHGNVDSEPTSDRDRSDSNATDVIDDGKGSSSKSVERSRDAQGRASLPRRESSETSIGDSTRLQVPDKMPPAQVHGLLPARTVESAAEENSTIQEEGGAASVGAPRWIVGQKTTTIIVALGMLALGMCIGAYDRLATSSVRAPATALVRYGEPVGRHTARSIALGGKLDLQALAVEHMRIAQEVMREMHEAWPVLVAAAAQEGTFNDRDGSKWPRLSAPAEALLPPGDLYIRTFNRPSFKYRSVSEELMNGPWV